MLSSASRATFPETHGSQHVLYEQIPEEASGENAMIRPRRAATAAIVAGTIFAAAAHADTAEEIKHLLDYVGGSGCTFARNGVESDAAEARKHLETKYAYAKSKVGSTEDFIRLAASQSSMTGQPYLVHCGTSRFLSGDWLTDELRRYRGDAAR